MTPEPVTSLIYVSRKTAPGDDAAVQEILRVSRERNKALHVTGDLVSVTGTFAQLIEGPEPAIAELMESINRDTRHRQISVLRVLHGVNRRFANWTMAYSGNDFYMERHLERLLDAPSGPLRAERLEQLEMLMKEFASRLGG